MSFYVLKVATEDQVPEGHASRDLIDLDDFAGGYVVDVDSTTGIGLSRDRAKARRFGTEQEAFAFSRIDDLRSVPLSITRVDMPEEGDHAA